MFTCCSVFYQAQHCNKHTIWFDFEKKQNSALPYNILFALTSARLFGFIWSLHFVNIVSMTLIYYDDRMWRCKNFVPLIQESWQCGRSVLIKEKSCLNKLRNQYLWTFCKYCVLTVLILPNLLAFLFLYKMWIILRLAVALSFIILSDRVKTSDNKTGIESRFCDVKVDPTPLSKKLALMISMKYNNWRIVH